MKPIKLRISAFGPFPGLIEIDFSRFERDGLFLLSGETGAGKTTIFDAISYALYGEVSGGTRGSDHLRSDFAKVETETFVELDFEHRGERYSIYRSPRYERLKLRGEGVVEKAATVQLTMPGRVLTKPADIDSTKKERGAIEELLSVNYDQFKQIIMIAQGEFLALLTAKSDDRTEIMRRVFGTGIFADVQERLKVLADKAKGEKNAISAHLEQLKAGLVDDIDTSDARVSALTEAQGKLKAELDKLLIRLEQASSLNGMLASLEAGMGKAQALEQTYAELEVKLQALKANEPQREQLRREIAEIEGALPKYAEFTAKSRALNEKTKALSQSDEEQKALDEVIAKQKAELSELKQELDALANAETEALKAKTALDEANRRKTRLKELCAAADEFKEKSALYEQAQRAYFESKRLYDDALAGRLAEGLIDGAPCPVCGSTEHPTRAVAPKSAPTQAEYELSEQRYNDALSKSSAAKGARDNLALELGIAQEEAEATAALQEKLVNELMGKKRLADEGVQQLHARQKRKEQLEPALEQSGERLRALTDSAFTLKTEAEVLTVEITGLQKELKHGSEEAAAKKLGQIKAELQQAQSLLEQQTEEHQAVREQIASIKALMESELQKALALAEKLGLECKPVDTADVEGQQKALLEQQRALEAEIRAALSAKENNERIASELCAYQDKLKAAEALYGDAEVLYKTASGNLTGKNKLQFETYVQQVYFDMVLVEANRRLSLMTDGRYELVRQSADKKQGKSGLDIDVFDGWSQKTRPAKTLSGGESFKAALALALGLSDVVQSHSGGIQIDAMFIDEGFGSLDGDSLDSAMNVISGLADGSRLVGIISHVDALKERIPQKILVMRDKVGSRVLEQD